MAKESHTNLWVHMVQQPKHISMWWQLTKSKWSAGNKLRWNLILTSTGSQYEYGGNESGREHEVPGLTPWHWEVANNVKRTETWFGHTLPLFLLLSLLVSFILSLRATQIFSFFCVVHFPTPARCAPLSNCQSQHQLVSVVSSPHSGFLLRYLSTAHFILTFGFSFMHLSCLSFFR